MSKEDGKPELVQYEKLMEDKAPAHRIATAHPENTPTIAVILSIAPDGKSIIEFTIPTLYARADTPEKRRWVREVLEDMVDVLQENRKNFE